MATNITALPSLQPTQGEKIPISNFVTVFYFGTKALLACYWNLLTAFSFENVLDCFFFNSLL